MTDENIIDTLEAISLLRSSKRLNRSEVMATLDQAEELINWLIVESAESTTAALRVAEQQARELSRLKENNGKPSEITLHIARHTAGNA